MSFNYPVNPTAHNKKKYSEFIRNLVYLLPCKFCRINLKKNLNTLPITREVMKNRDTFSKYVYDLHKLINKMLCKRAKTPGYKSVQNKYEQFRSRCTKKESDKNTIKRNNKTRKKERGCIDPLHGKKSKCIIKIVQV
jgi:hypothetical protein